MVNIKHTFSYKATIYGKQIQEVIAFVEQFGIYSRISTGDYSHCLVFTKTF